MCVVRLTFVLALCLGRYLDKQDVLITHLCEVSFLFGVLRLDFGVVESPNVQTEFLLFMNNRTTR